MAAVFFLILRILLSLILYGFLFYMAYLLWVDFNQKGLKTRSYKNPLLTLTIKSPTHEDLNLVFTKDDVLIGREADCDCKLDDDQVSGHHARCNFHHGQWWLIDLNSLNGTFINDQRLTSSVVLIDGDEIQCGTSRLLVAISGENNPTIPVVKGK